MIDLADDEVLVASFRLEDEAHAAIRALEAEGISARLAVDEAFRIAVREAMPIVGTGVLVGSVDADRARAILDAMWSEAERSSPSARDRCPACGSDDFAVFHRLRIFLLVATAAVILGFLTDEMRLFMLTLALIGGVLAVTPNRRCRNCGERWRGRRRVAAIEEEAPETPPVPCPRCGAPESVRIDRRGLRAIALIVNLVVPPFFVVWPFMTKRRCERCGHEWR